MIQQFSFEPTGIDGLIVVNPFCAEDKRGFYLKSYSERVFREQGYRFSTMEISYTKSHKGVVRGLHFQYQHSQPKMSRCVCGRVFDVVIDVRRGSRTLGKWFGLEMTPENRKSLFIPAGFAHGSLSMEEGSTLIYESAENYYPEYDIGISWDDPDVGIVWPTEQVQEIILSDKDQNLMSYCEFIRDYGGVPV